MRAVLYARVSTEEQVEGYSIEAQRRAFRTLCEGRGWTPYREYIEEGKSARTENLTKRPVFNQMIADALAGQFDVLVVHKLDRFSRNLRVTLEYFDRLLKAKVAFVSINEQMDFTTPSGKVHLALLGAFAQYYSDNLSQETKKGWHERRIQGVYCGTLPFGAMKGKDDVPIPDTIERNRVIDGREIAVCNHDGLKMMFELASEGKSDREIALSLTTAGYRTSGTRGSRPFSNATVNHILSNRFYVGYIPNGDGQWIRAKHEPLIDPELFDRVQQVREVRKRPRCTINANARTYSLSTLMWCNKCQSKMRVQMDIRGRARVYCAGRLKGATECDSRSTFLDIYEAQIEWYLGHFEIPQDYQEAILDAHSKLQAAYHNTEPTREDFDKRLARIKELYEWGDISRQEYLNKREGIQGQLRALAQPENKREILSKLAHFLANVADAWREATQEQRHKLAKTLLEQVWVEDRKVVAVKPRPEFEPFFKLNFEHQTKHIACKTDGD